jgi:hypothetical protein
MTEKTHLEEFRDGVNDALSRQLVEIFVECRRDLSMKPADIITRLKEKMEGALSPDDDPAD